MSDITEIGTVIVLVSDQDRALAFYVDVLGFEVRLDGPFGEGRWLEVAPRGAATTLALVAGGGPGGEVSFTTRDADADHARLVAEGMDVDEGVMRIGDGVPPMFTFRDPDGNRCRVVERP